MTDDGGAEAVTRWWGRHVIRRTDHGPFMSGPGQLAKLRGGERKIDRSKNVSKWAEQ